MKPWMHAKSSARKFGGVPQDYLDIHQFMDSTKAALADVRHRAILHNAFGCFVVERVFGVVRLNSDGEEYSPRQVAEQHCLEDLGRIPSIQDWLEKVPFEEWMGPPRKQREFLAFTGRQQTGAEVEAERSEEAEALLESLRGRAAMVVAQTGEEE